MKSTLFLSKFIFSKKTSLLFLLFFLLSNKFSLIGSNSKYVDLFIGTAGDNGQVDPAACVPYGMVRIAPDCKPRSHSGYDYEITKISGFSINRISGIGCDGAGGNLTLCPALKSVDLEMDKSTEKAIPGYYTVKLDNGVKAEFTATNNVAIERFSYPKGKKKSLTIDFYTSFGGMLGAKYQIVTSNEIKGYIHSKNTCGHGAYKLYFHITSDKDFLVENRSERYLEILYSGTKAETVELRIALSPINEETAKKENELTFALTFEQIKKQAEREWNDMLSRIEIDGSKEEKILFYTSLYRVFLSPADVTSWNGRYLGTNGKIYNKTDFIYYSSWSMWDTYRTKFPLITLIDANRMRDISASLCKLYVNGKRDWATKYESTPTVRTEHSATVILDAYKKGITDIDLEEVYESIKKEVESLPMNRPDQIMESCIDIWTLGEIAGILNKYAEAEYYAQKAKKIFIETWSQYFKDIDDSFAKMRDSGLYQGTRWQYRWALPQYLDIMKESVGGEEKLAEELDYFFANYLNNQGNEPGLHAPFIFNRLHEPFKTQKYVTRILHEETPHIYGGNAEYPEPVIGKVFRNHPVGYLPEMDEDDGTMSAWYVFSTIGLFPLVVGEPYYELTSPSFDNTVIRLDNANIVQIKTKGRKSMCDPVKEVRFNSILLPEYQIDHNELIKGGVLEFIY